MAYRQIERKKTNHRVLQDFATKNVTMVQNGATAYLAIPCWYMEVRHPQHTHLHDREWHDHIGWPDPKRPDHSCQNAYALRHGTPYVYDEEEAGWHHIGRYLDMSSMFPIHLREEGYSDIDVAFANPPEGLDGHGYIDPDDDWVARFVIHPMCPEAAGRDIDVEYAVFALGQTGAYERSLPAYDRRDVIARGTLRILAGPIE